MKRAIKKIEIIEEKTLSGDPEKKDLHIAFGIDKNFCRPMGVVMTSIILNNRSRRIVFHVFIDEIHNDDFKRLRELVENYSVKIKIYFIDSSVFQGLKSTFNWSVATYFRFVAAYALHEEVERLLYLDADMTCMGDIGHLFDIDFSENVIVAVHDIIDPNAYEEKLKKIKITSGKYFNAGMLCIDIRKWNELKVSERAIEMLFKNPNFYDYLDQDVLNILLEYKVLFIDEIYNYIYNVEMTNEKIPSNVKIIHYTGRQKPWHWWCTHSMIEYFRQYALQSPWNDVKWMDQPRHYKEMKMMGKACLVRGEYLKSIQWFWKYAYYKLKKKCF